MPEVKITVIDQPSVEDMARENVTVVEGLQFDDGGNVQVPADHPLVNTVSTLRGEKKTLDDAHAVALEALEAQHKANIDALGVEHAAKLTEAAQTATTEADKVSAVLRAQSVRDKIALAARKFVDPQDAVALVLAKQDMSAFIESDALDDMIAAEVKALSEAKPHLLPTGEKPQADLDAGSRGSDGEKKTSSMQMTQQIREAAGYTKV